MATHQIVIDTAKGTISKDVIAPITSFRYPEDFQKACSKEGVSFWVMKRVIANGKEDLVQSDRVCLVKVRKLVRDPLPDEAERGVKSVELLTANMWIDGRPGCRMDRKLEYYDEEHGKQVLGDMMEALPNLDRSDQQICEMDKTRTDGEGARNGFWSNPKLAFHSHESGTVKWMGRSLLSVLDSYCMEKGMTSFTMRTPTEHEREIVMDFYLRRQAAVMYFDPPKPDNPRAIKVEFKKETTESKPRVYDEGVPYPGTLAQS